MKKDRFDLEQDIMDAWHSQNDLDLIINNIENMDEDKMMNALIGLSQIMELRMAKVFNTFEELIKLDTFKDTID